MLQPSQQLELYEAIRICDYRPLQSFLVRAVRLSA